MVYKMANKPNLIQLPLNLIQLDYIKDISNQNLNSI